MYQRRKAELKGVSRSSGDKGTFPRFDEGDKKGLSDVLFRLVNITLLEVGKDSIGGFITYRKRLKLQSNCVILQIRCRDN